MPKYHFALTFQLAPTTDPESLLDALFEAGCDDSTPATGKRGFLGLEFHREAPNQAEAIETAIANVQQAVSEARLMATTIHEELTLQMGNEQVILQPGTYQISGLGIPQGTPDPVKTLTIYSVD